MGKSYLRVFHDVVMLATSLSHLFQTVLQKVLSVPMITANSEVGASVTFSFTLLKVLKYSTADVAECVFLEHFGRIGLHPAEFAATRGKLVHWPW